MTFDERTFGILGEWGVVSAGGAVYGRATLTEMRLEAARECGLPGVANERLTREVKRCVCFQRRRRSIITAPSKSDARSRLSGLPILKPIL